MDPRLVVDADVVADVIADVVVRGAIGPLISNSSKAPRFPDVGVVAATGFRCFDDDDDDAAAAGVEAAAVVADTRAALADCGVWVGAGADFLDGAGRGFVCCAGCCDDCDCDGGGAGGAFCCAGNVRACRGVGVGAGATAGPPLTSRSSSSSPSSRASEKLLGPGLPLASVPVPVPRRLLEPSSWASSSSAAVRAGERRGVWAAEEERLGAGYMHACMRACGVSMGPFNYSCV